MNLLKVSKGGRGPSFRNHNATNHGTVVHYVEGPEEHGFWSKPAICGAEPSSGGVGWVKMEIKDVTCKKCLKKADVFLK